MRIIVVGSTGTLGSAIVKELSNEHEVVTVAHSHGNIRCDIASADSIREMYEQAGEFDALVSATGRVQFDDLEKMNEEKYAFGLQNKLMGQVNLVLIGLKYINDGGSFTLISGILNHIPIPKGSSAAMVNGAIDGFVKAASIELPRDIRINAVSPTVVAESMDKYASYFKGFEPVPVAKVALAFKKSIDGLETGHIFRVGYTLP